MKKIFLAILMAGIALFCVGCMSAEANDVDAYDPGPLHENKEMKLGKYYRDGGTEEQYIEIYKGFGIQLFGFNLYERSCELSKEMFASMSEEELTPILEELKKDCDWRESYLYYQIEPITGDLIFKSSPEILTEDMGGYSLKVIDENTLEFDEGECYIYREE